MLGREHALETCMRGKHDCMTLHGMSNMARKTSDLTSVLVIHNGDIRLQLQATRSTGSQAALQHGHEITFESRAVDVQCVAVQSMHLVAVRLLSSCQHLSSCCDVTVAASEQHVHLIQLRSQPFAHVGEGP